MTTQIAVSDDFSACLRYKFRYEITNINVVLFMGDLMHNSNEVLLVNYGKEFSSDSSDSDSDDMYADIHYEDYLQHRHDKELAQQEPETREVLQVYTKYNTDETNTYDKTLLIEDNTDYTKRYHPHVSQSRRLSFRSTAHISANFVFDSNYLTAFERIAEFLNVCDIMNLCLVSGLFFSYLSGRLAESTSNKRAFKGRTNTYQFHMINEVTTDVCPFCGTSEGSGPDKVYYIICIGCNDCHKRYFRPHYIRFVSLEDVLKSFADGNCVKLRKFVPNYYVKHLRKSKDNLELLGVDYWLLATNCLIYAFDHEFFVNRACVNDIIKCQHGSYCSKTDISHLVMYCHS